MIVAALWVLASPINGVWAGKGHTSSGTTSSTYLCMTDHAGTWGGLKITEPKTDGRRTTWSSTLEWRRYDHTFEVAADGKHAAHTYEVVDTENKGRGYSGTAEYERLASKSQLSGLWIGQYKKTDEGGTRLSVCVGQIGKRVVGDWNGNAIDGVVKDGVASWQNAGINHCLNYGMTMTVADDGKTATLDYNTDDYCQKQKSTGLGTLTKQ